MKSNSTEGEKCANATSVHAYNLNVNSETHDDEMTRFMRVHDAGRAAKRKSVALRRRAERHLSDNVPETINT